MNSRRNLSYVLVAIAALALGGWLWTLEPGVKAPPAPLAGSGIGGSFALVDQNGRTFTDKDLKGKYALMYFGYTFCPDVCPLDAQKLSAALAVFEKADPVRGARVQPVFVTVDPERDTPAVLKQFVANFHPRLVGLTGTTAQIDAMKKEYRIYARRAGTPGDKDYLVDHLAIFYLMGPGGEPISLLGHDATVEQVTAELAARVG